MRSSRVKEISDPSAFLMLRGAKEVTCTSMFLQTRNEIAIVVATKAQWRLLGWPLPKSKISGEAQFCVVVGITSVARRGWYKKTVRSLRRD